MAYIKQRLNGDTVNVYELAKTVVIGRHLSCHIVVEDPTVSAKHAQLTQGGNGYEISDLGSTNGVLIGKERVTRRSLRNGDLFVIGTHEFEYLAEMPTDLDQTLRIKKSWIPGVYYTR